MITLKTYGAIAIMIGCFAVVYPRFMHPLVANIFGFGDAHKTNVNNKDGNGANPMYPPGGRGAQGARPEDMRKNMRHGPHPGMRAAAEMQRQQHQGGGSGRGMMGVVLPMYAVGIVLYLGYTLYKVFNKTNAKNNGATRYSWDKTSRSNNRDRDRMGFPQNYDGNSEIRNFLHDQEHRQNLEDLLTRVDDKNVSVEEMKVLQSRLEETEAQMTRILQAMRGINDNVDNLGAGENETANSEGGNNADEGKENIEESPSQDDDAKDSGREKEEVKGGKEDEDQKGDQDHDDDIDEDVDVEKENNDDEQENVDESKDDNGDDDVDVVAAKDETSNAATVRQRNVKSNEQ